MDGRIDPTPSLSARAFCLAVTPFDAHTGRDTAVSPVDSRAGWCSSVTEDGGGGDLAGGGRGDRDADIRAKDRIGSGGPRLG